MIHTRSRRKRRGNDKKRVFGGYLYSGASYKCREAGIRNKEADGDVEQSVLFYVRENQVQYLFFSSVLYMEVLTNTNAGRNEMHAYIFFFNIQ